MYLNYPQKTPSVCGTLTIRPTLDLGRILGVTKPTPFYYGVFQGYSMPIWNSDNEELSYRTKIPERWDGVTNPQAIFYTCLMGSEDIDDKFKFQFDAAAVQCDNGDLLPLDATAYYSETTILEDKNSQYNIYCINFELNAENITAGDLAAGRLRRIDSSGTEVDNEIGALYFMLEFKTNKIYNRWKW